MRRLGRYRRKRQNRIILITAFSLLFVITAGYAAFSTNITFHAKGNIIKGPRVIQAWDENSQTDFHSDYYKQNIVSVTFTNNSNVPDSAVESWNVSEDKTNGEVMAWVVPSAKDSSKYDLYIGAKAGVIANENSGYVFYNFRGLKEINFDDNYDTSNATDMELMFDCCTSLEELDLSSFDTSNVTSMYAMFCMWDSELNAVPENNLTSIKFGNNFITNNVTNMRSMFAGLTKLTNLDVSRFNTSNVTTMYHMFNYCISLTELDLSNFDTFKVTDMEGMFCGCQNLTKLDISNFNTFNVTNMDWMFSMWDGNNQKCSTNNLKELDVSSFNTSNVTSMHNMFSCSNVSEIKGLENFNTSNVTDMYHMFNWCEKLERLNLCSFDTRNVNDMQLMMGNTYNLKKVYVGPNWTTENANANDMFTNSGASSVTTGQC